MNSEIKILQALPLAPETASPPTATSLSANRDADFVEVQVTHGHIISYKYVNYQGHCAPAFNRDEVEAVVESVRLELPYNGIMCYAFRVDTDNDETREEERRIAEEEGMEYDGLSEGVFDERDPGVGEKLMYLLRRWEVMNCLIIVTRRPSSMKPPCNLGMGRYKAILKCAKQVLELAYRDADEAKLTPEEDLATATARAVQKAMEDAGAEGRELTQKEINKIEEAVELARTRRMIPTAQICAASVPWPAAHNPVRGVTNLGEKKGRPAHFLAGRASAQSLSGESEIFDVLAQPDHMLPRPANPVPPPPLSRADVIELCSMKCPPPGMQAALHLTATLLDVSDTSWAGCLKMMAQGAKFAKAISCIDITSLPIEAIDKVRQELQRPNFQPGYVRRESLTACVVLEWLIEMVQSYDRLTLGKRPTQPSMEARRREMRNRAGAKGLLVTKNKREMPMPKQMLGGGIVATRDLRSRSTWRC